VNSVRKLSRRAINGCRFVLTYSQHLPLAFEAIFSMPCAVTKLRGTIRHTGEQLMMLYVGRRMNYMYLLRAIFDEYHIEDEQRSSLLTFRKHMNRMNEGSDVVIIDLGCPYNSVSGDSRLAQYGGDDQR
jgi:hypothetical protein